MYDRLMRDKIEVLNVYAERGRFFVELSRSLNERERERLEQVEVGLGLLPSRRLVVRDEVVGSEFESAELQIAAPQFLPYGVIEFSVSLDHDAGYAGRRLAEIEAHRLLLNTELQVEHERKVAALTKSEQERARDRALGDTVAAWRRKRKA